MMLIERVLSLFVWWVFTALSVTSSTTVESSMSASTIGIAEVRGACFVTASPRGTRTATASLWDMPVASKKSTTIRRSISTSDSPSKVATPMVRGSRVPASLIMRSRASIM